MLLEARDTVRKVDQLKCKMLGWGENLRIPFIGTSERNRWEIRRQHRVIMAPRAFYNFQGAHHCWHDIHPQHSNSPPGPFIQIAQDQQRREASKYCFTPSGFFVLATKCGCSIFGALSKVLFFVLEMLKQKSSISVRGKFFGIGFGAGRFGMRHRPHRRTIAPDRSLLCRQPLLGQGGVPLSKFVQVIFPPQGRSLTVIEGGKMDYGAVLIKSRKRFPPKKSGKFKKP